LFSAVIKPATAALFGDEPTKKNVHVGEEVDVVDNLSTIPSTSVDDKVETDVRRGLKLKHNEPNLYKATNPE
jgi:hypothetical protein